MYACRPDNMEEAYGYYWPDGAPLCFYEIEVEWKTTFVDKDGKTFVIAYTIGQMQDQVVKHGYFQPYHPLMVSSLLLL